MILRTLGQQLVGKPHPAADAPSPPSEVDKEQSSGKVQALAYATRTHEVVSIGVSAYQRATLSPLDRARLNHVMEEALASRRARLRDEAVEEPPATIAGSRFLRELRHRDTMVRVQEAAFRARTQNYGSGSSYDYEFGTDGLRYAVAGEITVHDDQTSAQPESSVDGAEWVTAADELMRARLEADVSASSIASATFVDDRGQQ
jgi:hypothetical protein